MRLIFGRGAARSFFRLGLFLLLAICGGIPSRAQIFEAISGGSGEDAARGGVLYVESSPFGAGFISVGESNSFGINYDVYVVRTGMTGNVIWAATYDIGGIDIGWKIAAAREEYVITGFTEDTLNCAVENNAFLLKIDPYGGVRWARTYGGDSHEEGRDVAVATDPSGAEVYYVAGWSQSFGGAPTDGYLIKTNSVGQVLWARTYGERAGSGGSGVEYFNSCFVAANGDLIAAGSCHSYTNSYDVWIVRVKGSDGTIHRAAYYGGAGTDIANSVIELQNAPFAGEIVAVGRTTSFNNTDAAFLLRVTGTLAAAALQVVDDGVVPTKEEFLQVVETPFQEGGLLVCGRFENNPNGYGLYDGYLGEYNASLGMPPLWDHLYGGERHDGLWSVAVAPGNPGSPSYSAIAVGATSSFNFFGGTEDEYWVRANRGGASGCKRREPATIHDYREWPETYIDPCHPMIRISYRAEAVVAYNELMERFCIAEGSIHRGGDPNVDPATVLDPVSGRDAGIGTARIETPSAPGGMTATLPNPVRRGEPFALRFARPEGVPLTVTVTDVTGSRILTKQLVSRGEGTVTIPTEGWAAGAYLVTVDGGGRTETTRLIVGD